MNLYFENRTPPHSKFYRMRWDRSLRQGRWFWVITTWRGRLGTIPTVYEYVFDDKEAMQAKLRDLEQLRYRHGYVRRTRPSVEQLEMSFVREEWQAELFG
jgi:predicted DNA-binding WGR domain protein